MSIATILPNILVECGLDSVSATINSSDFQMRQMLSIMNAAGDDINTRVEWSKAAATLTVTGGATSVALPADFQEMAEGGAVQITGATFTPVRPVVSPAMWEMLSASASAQPYYHIKGGFIHFSPAIPAGGATVRYVSNGWVVGGANAITDNDDTVIFPENLLARATIYRWKRQKGLPFDDLMAEFEADLDTAIKADRGVA